MPVTPPVKPPSARRSLPPPPVSPLPVPPLPVPPLPVPPLPVPPLLVAEVTALRGEVRGLGAEVRALGGEVRRQGRTDWPAVLTAGGLAATVLAGLGTLALDPIKAQAARTGVEVKARAADHAAAIDRVRSDMRTLGEQVRDHTINGHRTADARLDALERRDRP